MGRICRGIMALLAAVWIMLAMAEPVRAEAEAAQVHLRTVRVQLKWQHQFQFAGFYAAIEQGYFRDAGLDVRLIEGGPDIDPSKVVTEGRADFGVGTSSLILDRAKGLPVVALAAILQHSPFVLAVRPDAGIDSPKDLQGHSLMLEAHADELLAYLRLQGVDLAKVRMLAHSGDIRDLENRVDAASVYTTDEPYELLTLKIPHMILTPRSAKIDFYGDTLFTTSALAESDPALVRSMRDALIRGWGYALDHQGAVVRLVHTKYAPGLSLLKLQFEADEIRRLMDADLVAIGYMNPKRWQAIAQQFQTAGMMPREVSLKGFLFDEGVEDWRRYILPIGLLSVAVLGLLVLLQRLWALSRRLRREHLRRVRLEETLLNRGEADPVTGLPNRRRFEELALTFWAEVREKGGELSLVLLDVDRLKDLNRQWGAALADEMLLALASAFVRSLVDGDLICRYAGGRFAILLPGRGAEAAKLFADGLRGLAALQAVPVSPGREVGVTVSVGVACWASSDKTLSGLLERAELGLYRAKSDGRNRVVLEEVPLVEKTV